MEIRKGISSVVFVVIVCLCALWSSSTWAQAFSYSHAPDLPSTLSPSEKQSIQSYSLTVFKNALSKNGIDLTPATNTLSNSADVLINTSNSYLHHEGVLASKYLEMGGKTISDESKKWHKNYGVIQVGGCAITRAG